MNFGQNSEIMGLQFCANMKFRTQPVVLVNCLKSLIFHDWNDLCQGGSKHGRCTFEISYEDGYAQEISRSVCNISLR